LGPFEALTDSTFARTFARLGRRIRPPNFYSAVRRLVRAVPNLTAGNPEPSWLTDMRPALINGVAGAVAFLHGQPFSIGAVTVRNRKIVELDFFADPERLPYSTWRSSTTEEATIATEPSVTNASSAAIPTARNSPEEAKTIGRGLRPVAARMPW
jgi:hypothetical protein